MILYHLTTKNKLKSIIENGLIPSIGENSINADENSKRIYLTDYKSLNYWRMTIKYDIVLKININEKDEITKYNYDSAYEYIYNDPIDSKNIIKIIDKYKLPIIKKCEIEEFLYNRLWFICYIVLSIIRVYERGENITEYYNLKHDTSIILKYFNFDLIPKYKKCKMLKEIGDSGEYTFLDTYNNDNIKLYQILSYIKDNECNKLKYFIEEQFNGCLDLDTGGYITPIDDPNYRKII